MVDVNDAATHPARLAIVAALREDFQAPRNPARIIEACEMA